MNIIEVKPMGYRWSSLLISILPDGLVSAFYSAFKLFTSRSICTTCERRTIIEHVDEFSIYLFIS